MDDWLEGDREEKQEALKAQALETAQLYLVFEEAPRAVQLLQMWEERLIEVETPDESSLQKFAADNALRRFVVGIKRQIKLAKEGFDRGA